MFFFFFDENNKGVPSFEQMIKPVLIALQEKGGKSAVDELDKTAIKIMELPEEITKIMHKNSNSRSEISYRMAWARTYLKKYGLIKNESRGIWSLTDMFDGDIEKIDVEEIVRKVRNDGGTGDEDKQTLTGVESSIAFENMVKALLTDLAKKEGKAILDENSHSAYTEFDMILPEGLENIQEEIKCIIKYVNISRQNVQIFYDEFVRKFTNFSTDSKYMLVTNIVVSGKVRENLGQNVIVWDKNDLAARVDPEAIYAQYLINPKQALIEDAVTINNTGEQEHKKNKYIQQIRKAFHSQDLVLLLGAGVSQDAGIPLWEALIKKLHIHMLNKLTKGKTLNFEEKEMVKELAVNNEMKSPLLQMRYIKEAFQDEEYIQLVHTALYGQGYSIDTKLLNAIARISTPQRGYCGIKSIITYNFDDLLEMKLKQKDIRYNVISCEQDRQLIDKLNIYHVHGYLPYDHDRIISDPNLIFSEEDYHRVYRDAYSWSNLVQLSAFRENTCLFIGSSLTDPNLRRLLDVAARNGEESRHFAFLVKNEINSQDAKRKINQNVLEIYQRIDDNIRTAYYKKLGLNIVWIENYEQIPDILNGFLE